jgi:Domain of unknown function (DUF4134)
MKVLKLKYSKHNKVMRTKRDKVFLYGAVLQVILLMTMSVAAQTVDGNAGLNQANTMVRGYFDTGINLMYAVGGVLGLIGGARVYSKWSHGDPDTGKVAAAWFGAAIFLVVVATVIKSFFGLT